MLASTRLCKNSYIIYIIHMYLKAPRVHEVVQNLDWAHWPPLKLVSNLQVSKNLRQRVNNCILFAMCGLKYKIQIQNWMCTDVCLKCFVQTFETQTRQIWFSIMYYNLFVVYKLGQKDCRGLLAAQRIGTGQICTNVKSMEDSLWSLDVDLHLFWTVFKTDNG